MTQPAPAGSATPPATPPPASAPASDPKAQGKVPEVPPTPQPTGDGGAPPEAKKPANQLEADLAARYGDEWEKMSPNARNHLMAAEMKSREADKRMQLTAKLKKDLEMTTNQANQLIEALKKDPWRVLSNPALGHDVRKLAEQYVWDMIQEQRMSPEQKEAVRLKMENEQMKAENQRAKDEQAQKEMDTLIAQRRAYWEKTIPEAIEKAGLPRTSYTVRRFAEQIKAAARMRVPADMDAIATQVKQELVDLQSRFLLPPKYDSETAEQYEDRVVNTIPEGVLKILRKADLRRLRAKGLAPKPGPKPNGVPTPAPSKKISMSEWMNQKDQRMGRS